MANSNRANESSDENILRYDDHLILYTAHRFSDLLCYFQAS